MKILVTAFIAIILSLYLPALSQKIVQYKIKQRQYEIKKISFSIYTRIFIVLVNVTIFMMATIYESHNSCIYLMIFSELAIVGALVDYQLRIIPNELLIVLLIIGIVFKISNNTILNIVQEIEGLLLIIVIFAGTAFVTKLFSNDIGIGAGDIKLSIIIAFILGYPNVIFFLLGTAIFIGIFSIVGIFFGIIGPKDTFPMCGFLMSGFCLALFQNSVEVIFLKLL